jgi:hypothetical protein
MTAWGARLRAWATGGDRRLRVLALVGLVTVAVSGLWAIQAPPTGWIAGQARPIQEADYSQEQNHLVFAPSDVIAIAKAVNSDRAYFAGTPVATDTPPPALPTPTGTPSLLSAMPDNSGRPK